MIFAAYNHLFRHMIEALDKWCMLIVIYDGIQLEKYSVVFNVLCLLYSVNNYVP